MLKIGVLVSGGGTNLQCIIDSIESGVISNCQIVTVVSSKADAYALERAKKHNIPGIYINTKDADYEEKLIANLKGLGVELVLMAGYMTVLSEKFVNEFPFKIINVHPSLIPSFSGKGYYGLKVHKAVLEKGVKITGATVHFVDAGTDTGPIIMQKAVEVFDSDTPETLQKRVMVEAEHIIFPVCVKLFAENRLEIKGNIVRRKD